MKSSLSEFIETSQRRVFSTLQNCLADLQRGQQGTEIEHPLLAAMGYSLLNGGKRIRPVLVYASANLFSSDNCPANNSTNNSPDNSRASGGLDAVAAAVECIHAYSLIHDDLPAMDDDHLRRGQPTCHIAYDEATAILAGDALQTLAFDCISNCTELGFETRIRLLQMLGRAAGAQGMVGGQAMDLAALDKSLNLQQLQAMHDHKTGALIKASILMGATATGAADATQLRLLENYADAIGLAFQVQDDILDVTSDTATLGKQQGADIAKNKPTYVSLLGLDGARNKAAELHQQALAALQGFDNRAETLRQMSAYIVERVC